MSQQDWTKRDIPPLAGRTAIVTGATSGIGKEAARALAEHGAKVILAVRNIPKAEKVAAEFRPNAGGEIVILPLDLASLKSVRAFADTVLKSEQQLDMLINNAGVMFCPYSTTEDGFERQIGVNHLGHFALTGLLMPLLAETKGSRVVSVASIAHKGGGVDPDDLNWENRSYKAVQAYCDSKQANLLFMRELNKRLRGRSADPVALAAHPGWTATELQRHSPMTRIGNWIFGQKAEIGALPTLRAATDPSANIGDYYGPRGLAEMRGLPVKVGMEDKAKDDTLAARLWELSEALTEVRF